MQDGKVLFSWRAQSDGNGAMRRQRSAINVICVKELKVMSDDTGRGLDQVQRQMNQRGMAGRVYGLTGLTGPDSS